MGFFDKINYISTIEGATLTSISKGTDRIRSFTLYDYWSGMGSITFEDEVCENGMKDYRAYSLMDETNWRPETFAAGHMFDPDCWRL